MTVTMTMTIPLRASRANLDLPIHLYCAHIHLLIHPPSTLIPTSRPMPCATPVCRWFGLSVIYFNFLFFGLLCCVFFWLWSHVTSLHTQWPNQRPSTPPISSPFVFFIPWHLPYPRVHRPPKSREACKDHGASEWRALDWIKEYPQLRPRAWRMSYALHGALG